jgi:type IV pilus assembly protein PilW
MNRLAERGFGLIELMVSLAIASFLVLGLVVVAGNTQSTYSTQTSFAAVNDKERFAAGLLGNAIQTAGYFSVLPLTVPIQTLPTALGAFPAAPSAGANYAVGQVIAGATGASASVPDTLNVRFQSNLGDTNTVNCLGAPVGATAVVESMFTISNGNLVCQVGLNGGAPGAATVLIDGVSNMKILYGLDAGGSGSVTEYIPAGNIASINWGSVHSVNITLTFAATATMPSPQTYSQTFQVMYAEP